MNLIVIEKSGSVSFIPTELQVYYIVMFQVMLIHPVNAQSALLEFAHNKLSYVELCADLKEEEQYVRAPGRRLLWNERSQEEETILKVSVSLPLFIRFSP